MKKFNNWVVKSQEVGQNPIVTFERTSLTKTLASFVKLLSGVKVFIIAIPEKKTYVVYRKNKGETK